MIRQKTSLHIDPRTRYRGLWFTRWASSPTVVWAAIILGGVGVAMGIVSVNRAVAWEITISTNYLIAIVCMFLSTLFFWLFVYGITFRPYQKPPHTISDVLGGAGEYNLAEAAEYSLLLLLGRHYRSGDIKDVTSLFGELIESSSMKRMLSRLDIKQEDARNAIETYVLPDFSWASMTHVLEKYLSTTNAKHLSTVDICASFFLHPRMRNVLRQQGLREEDVLFVAKWENAREELARETRRWWTKERLLSFRGIGLTWAAGYTPFIDMFSRLPNGSAWDVGSTHIRELELVTNSLARNNQSNVLLIGQPGVGRIGVAQELMQRIQSGTSHPALKNQRAVYLHMSQLVSLGSTPSAQATIISRALTEMERAGNIVVILDGLGSVIKDSGTVNISELLVPFFNSSSVRVVVIMSTEDYRQHFSGNEELERLFEVVEVPPLSGEETLWLLALSAEAWEQEHDIEVSYVALREVVESTASILPHIPFPEKAFDVLDELVAETQASGATRISADAIHTLIARKTGVDVGRLKAEESQKLLSLKDHIHRRVVNQEEGVEAITRAMVRARTGIRSGNKPIGSFLFLGPTGVGKTETAKALAEAYFGSTDYLQRLDMSEFQGEDAVERLVGTIEKPIGRLPSVVMNHPFSVLLLDEFEKASKTVQELFLPLFDEGYFTDAQGRKYSFVHTIIIATSNAGSELIRKEIKNDGTLSHEFDTQLREHILSEGIFLPELLNRFDGVVTFTPLSPDHIRQIAMLLLADLNKRLDAEHGIRIKITEDLLSYLVSEGYDPEFGARPMKRLIQDAVEYPAAQYILQGRVEAGQEVIIPIPQANKNGYSAKDTSSTRVPSST